MRMIVITWNDNLMISENPDMEYRKVMSIQNDIIPEHIDYMLDIVKDEIKGKLFWEKIVIMDKLPKCYKSMSKKELRDQLLRQMNDNIMIVSENYTLNTMNRHLEQQLQSAENALDYKEKVIEKYKKLLEVSIEDL